MASSFADKYPYIDTFVTAYGWIEIGYDEYSHSFIRALDIGGWVWEGKHQYASLDDAFADLEQGLADWLNEVIGTGEE